MTIVILTVEAEVIGTVMQMVIDMKEMGGDIGDLKKKIGVIGHIKVLLGKEVLKGEQKLNNGIESEMGNGILMMRTVMDINNNVQVIFCLNVSI